VSQTDDVTVGKLLIMEYERIKEEQKVRIGFRDNLLYATLGSMGAIIAAVVSSGNNAPTLLLPPVSLVLGWTYLVNDEKISAIGRYIRTELTPRLSELTTKSSPVLGWETAHRSDGRRSTRKYLQLAIDLITFCCSPIAGIIFFWSADPRSIALVVLSIIELLAIAILAIQIFVYADLKSTQRSIS
jgi:hypothetical protein